MTLALKDIFLLSAGARFVVLALHGFKGVALRDWLRCLQHALHTNDSAAFHLSPSTYSHQSVVRCTPSPCFLCQTNYSAVRHLSNLRLQPVQRCAPSPFSLSPTSPCVAPHLPNLCLQPINVIHLVSLSRIFVSNPFPCCSFSLEALGRCVPSLRPLHKTP